MSTSRWDRIKRGLRSFEHWIDRWITPWARPGAIVVLLALLVLLVNLVWNEGLWTDPKLLAAGALTVGGLLVIAFQTDAYSLIVGLVAAICGALAVDNESPVLGWVTLGLLTAAELIGKYREGRVSQSPSQAISTVV